MNATVNLNFLRAFVAAAAVTVVAGAQAGTFTLVDGEGYEAPDYSLGILEGQFASTFEGIGSAAWVQSPLGGTSTAVVQDTIVASGTQAVQVDRDANSDDRWAVPITGAPSLDMPLICIEWDMLVEQATGSHPYGPFFGVEAYDDDATSILRIGSLGVDAQTGDVLLTDRPSGLVETGTVVTLGDWHSYRMVLDFTTDIYYSFVNDVLIATEDFESLGADQFTDADIAALAASGDAASQAATGTAYFDNYMVFETDEFSKIPEPVSLALVALGLGLAASRSRIR